MKKTKKLIVKTLGFALSALLMLLIIAIPNTAIRVYADSGSEEIYGIIVSFNGDSSSQRGISWYSAPRITESIVLVLENNESNWQNAKTFTGTRNKYNMQANGALERKDYYIHKTLVYGLDGGKKYKYKVGSSTLDVWSDIGYFETNSVDNKSVSFMVTSDVHFGASETPSSKFYENAIKSAYSNNGNLNFLAMTGDIVNQWSDELNTYVYKEDEWLSAYTGTSYYTGTTFVHSAGNHDINSENPDFADSMLKHYAISTPEGVETVNGINYSYDYGNAHFVVWNNANTDIMYTKAQLDWLEEDLSGTDKDWKIIFTHVPLYEGQLSYSDNLLPILERNNVDLVFSGHRHYYMRTKPMKDSAPVTTATVNESVGNIKKIYNLENSGTVYVTNSTPGGGSAWRIHNGAKTSNIQNTFGVNDTLAGIGKVTHGNGMYSIVNIVDNELTVDVYFRTTTSPTEPYVLLESYGNKKDYYKTLNRKIEAIAPVGNLSFGDLEWLLALQGNYNTYKAAFPELAANVTAVNVTKLNATIETLLDPEADKDPDKTGCGAVAINSNTLFPGLFVFAIGFAVVLIKNRNRSQQPS